MKTTGYALMQDFDFAEPMESTYSAIDTAERILAEIMAFRRLPEGKHNCSGPYCQKCSTWHLPNILSAVKSGKTVSFVLPAFPGKSPNPEKVLGHLPDHAEKLSLVFLGDLCKKIKKYYPPGIKIILCSDGRVFSDVVGMQEHHVTAYQNDLESLIKDLSLSSDICTFNLDEVYGELSFSQMRDELMKSYGQSSEFIKHRVRNGVGDLATAEEQEALHMYRGITRFLFEDSIFPDQPKSRNALQKESRSKAYEVIRRSNAWSDLIAERFPEAVRLSIHPHVCGSKKLGIRFIGNESWMTPWHGVALETRTGFVLLKRAQAEALNAEIVFSDDGRPSYYRMPVNKNILKEAFHGN